MTDSNPLKNWRDGLKLSQDEAGAKLGVDAMTVSRWERGEHLPRKKNWPRIEKVTGITPSQLVGYVKTNEVAQ